MTGAVAMRTHCASDWFHMREQGDKEDRYATRLRVALLQLFPRSCAIDANRLETVSAMALRSWAGLLASGSAY